MASPTYSSRTITDFKSRLVGGGARANLFEVELSFPSQVITSSEVNDDFRFMIKATSLPESTINVIDVPFRGRNLKVAGDRTFNPWSITVINDTNFKIRDAFEKWLNYMNRHDDNAGIITPAAYQRNMKVFQLSRGVVATNIDSQTLPDTNSTVPILKAYKFYGCFPTSVSAIDLSYESADTIEEFTVDLQVQWFDSLDSEERSILGTSETA